MTTADEPRPRAYLIVGTAARMRRSLAMAPSASSGTLKSTRMRRHWPCRSGKSLMVFFGMRSSVHGEGIQFLAQFTIQVGEEVGGGGARERLDRAHQGNVCILDKIEQFFFVPIGKTAFYR